MNATLGILITYHNEGELLRECLTSLVKGGQPDEVLIYDDASHLPPQAFIPSGIQARVIRGENNRGPAFGRNRLLEACRCDYVHFQDSDDLFDAAWLPHIRAAMAESAADVIWTEIATIRNGQRQNERILNLRALEPRGDLVAYSLRGPILVPSGTYRKKLLQQIGGYRESLWQSEDFDFHVRLALQHPRFQIIDKPLILQRLRDEGRSQKAKEVWLSTLNALRLLAEEMPAPYHRQLAEISHSTGSELYRLDAHAEAREAFALAERLGPPRYDKQWKLYRIVANLLGPETAERMAASYRQWLPGPVRRLMRWLGDHLGWHAGREGYF